MRWLVEDKLRFIKQYKKDRTVEKVDGCTEHTMLNCVKRWVAVYNAYGITQSMSRKGNYLDNAKIEGFFGLLKREMFYGSEFHYHSFNQFKRALINCINWYNKERIKLTLKMSPTQYRLKYYNKSSVLN